MSIEAKDTLLHWNYFLALEHDLEETARYVEFAKKNYNSYSIEFAHLLLASASEVDVVAKLICKLLDSTKKPNNIKEYRKVICSGISGYANEVILIPRFGLTLTPWSNWRTGKSPSWWKSYNKIKHERDSHFEEANLKNTLNSMAALLISVFNYYKLKFEHESRAEIDAGVVLMKLNTQPNLMRFPEHYYSGTPLYELFG